MTLTLLQHSKWTSFNHAQMGMMETVMSLDQLVDESDPDVDFPNSFHAFQTAEGIRKEHPDKGTIQRGRQSYNSNTSTYTHTHTHTCKQSLNFLHSLFLHRLVPCCGSDPWCWENHGSLGWTPGKRKIRRNSSCHYSSIMVPELQYPALNVTSLSD